MVNTNHFFCFILSYIYCNCILIKLLSISFYKSKWLGLLRTTLANPRPYPIKHANLLCLKIIIRLWKKEWYYREEWRSSIIRLSYICLWLGYIFCCCCSDGRIHHCWDSWWLFSQFICKINYVFENQLV